METLMSRIQIGKPLVFLLLIATTLVVSGCEVKGTASGPCGTDPKVLIRAATVNAATAYGCDVELSYIEDSADCQDVVSGISCSEVCTAEFFCISTPHYA